MHLTLHLTRDCNLRCDYCYAPPQRGAAMTEAVADAALRFAARERAGACGIVFFGGEPLLRKDLIRYTVNRARTMEHNSGPRFHFKLTTNGLLLDESFLDFALENDVLIAVSYDGTPEVHDRHRKRPGGAPSAARIEKRLRMLLMARPYASVMMVVNPDTAKALPDSVEYLLDLGARYLIVSLNHAAEWRAADMRVLHRAYRKLGRRYLEWTRAGRKFYLSPFEMKLLSHIDRDRFPEDRCELGERQLSVDPEGWLYPCVQFPRAGRDSEWCIGHVSVGVDRDRKRRLRERAGSEKEPCAHCAVRSRCLHTCGCLNWQTTGTVTEVSPVLCRHERMLIKIADRIGRTLFRERDPHFLHKHYNRAWPLLSLMEDRLRPVAAGDGRQGNGDGAPPPGDRGSDPRRGRGREPSITES
jgi:uncharacterized protein